MILFILLLICLIAVCNKKLSSTAGNYEAASAKRSVRNNYSSVKQLTILFVLMMFALLPFQQSLAQTFGISASSKTPYPQRFGHNTTGTGNNAGNFLIFDSVRLATGTTAIAIGAYGTAAGTVAVSIYSDNSGTPGTLLITAVTGTSIANKVTSYPIPPTFLAAGTYWIAYNMNSSNASANYIAKNTVSTGVNYRRSVATTYTATFPASAPATTALAVNTQDNIFIEGITEGYAMATKATLGATAQGVTSVSLAVMAPGNVNVAIYSNTSGAPGTKLWESGDSLVTAAGITTFNISAGTPTSLTALAAGTYWLAWQWVPNGAIDTSRTYYTVGASGSGNYITQGYGAFPSTWSGGTSTTMEWTEYASYSAISTGTIAGSPFCLGASVSVPYSSGSLMNGNKFTVELSNSTGSFASPTTIGTSNNNTTTSGTLSATIPSSGLTAGNGYLIRVVSSKPAVTGADNGVPLTINIAASAVSNTTLTASGTYATAITNYTITGTNNPTSFGASGLPPGLNIASATGVISGTPTSAGSYNVTISATNSCGTGTTKTLVFTIAKVALTITAGNQTISYGTAAATVTGAGTEIPTGFVNGDNASVITGTATYSTTYTTTTAAGASGITITPVVTGLSATNYSFTAATGTITISKAVLTITAGNQIVPYGTTATTVTNAGTETPSGFLNSQTASVISGSVTYTTTYTATTAAGTSGITITPVVTGLSATNYSFTAATGTITINKATLTVTASNETKCSGSTLTFAGTEFTTNGLVNTDVVSAVILTSAGTSSSASTGSYNIVPGAAIGTGLSNYTIGYSSGTLTVSGATWTGAVNSDWNTAGNWTCGTVPDGSIADVVILTSPYPVLNGDITLRNLTLVGASTLGLNGYTLTIDSAVAGTGALKGSSTSTLVLSGTTGTINFVTGGDTLKNLTLKNNATATLGSTLNIASRSHIPATLNIGSYATFNTADSLTLKSNDSSTAIVTAIPEDAITGSALGIINGAVTVERRVHSSVDTPNVSANGSYNISVNNGLRAWRLLTAPITKTNSETIKAAWQNNGAPYTPLQGVGTLITGSSASNGIDAVSSVSMFSWNNTLQSFATVSNTLGAISNGNYGGGNAGNTGYMLFIRGDRDPASINNPNNGGIHINNTTLNPKGNLITGRQSYTVQPSLGTSAGQTRFTLIGNPYAAPVNLANLTASNVRSQFYIWNPNLNTVGAFVLIDLTSGLLLSTPSTGKETQYIQSGQAFFAVGQTGTPCSLTFDENNKTDSNNNYVFRPATTPTESFRSNLYLINNNATTLADGGLVQYNDDYSTAVDYQDALKLSNTNETFSLMRDGVKLFLERRPIVSNTDTLFFNLTQSTQRAYQFQFITTAMNHPGLKGFLKDSYTKDSTALDLNGTTTVNFNIDATAASQNANRFMVVFQRPGVVLPVTFTSINAQDQNGNIPVSWNVQNEINIKSYSVQKSTDGKTFSDVATVKATGAAQYNWIDVNAVAGDNYYRIRSTGSDGAIQYSLVAKVNIGAINPTIAIYPNPVKEGVLGLKFNNMPKGPYTVKMLTTAGQQVVTKKIDYAGGNGAATIFFNSGITKGMYEVEIIKPDAATIIYNIEYQ